MLFKDVKIYKAEDVDIWEDNLLRYNPTLLELLLKDKTTNKNILWATDDYKKYGEYFEPKSEIKSELITGSYSSLIQPRITKQIQHQNIRTKEKAEVFTPSWICNKQNNLIDNEWFGKKNVFNIEKNNSWETTIEKIQFQSIKGKTWQDYVDARRLEISCGEAPYLVSRYDAVSGEVIAINNRIGLLDRKLRVVNENTSTEEEWLIWTTRAFQSIYGFELQGDNLLLARENLLYTFIDNYIYKWKKSPKFKDLKKIANIIVWNIWQMDGMTYTIPYSEKTETTIQLNIFINTPSKKTTQYCKIKDWRARKTIEYKSLIKGD